MEVALCDEELKHVWDAYNEAAMLLLNHSSAQ